MPTYGQYDVPSSDIMINLGVGQPDNRKLPLDLIKNAMKKFIDEESNPEVLQYGDIPGYKRFRKKMAEWLTKKCYQDIPDEESYQQDFEYVVNENELFITNGVTHALHLIMTAYMYQEDTILVEDPTYFIMINIFKEFGLHVIPISMDEDGINLEIVEEQLQLHCHNQEKVFLYTIPINHNPTGITMSHQKRQKLAALCDIYNNFHIIADEVYHFLSWEDQDEKLLPLADYHPNIISMGSFSKILAPSLRLGWIYENGKFGFQYQSDNVIDTISNCGLYDSTGGTGVLSSYLTEQIIDNGELDKYIIECQNFLGSRCKTICRGLSPLRDKGLIEFTDPKGGYFVWIKVKDILANELLEDAIKNKVKFHPGWKFTSNKNTFTDYIRLSISYYDETDLEIGVNRINTTIDNFNKTKVSVLGATGKLGNMIVEELNNIDDIVYLGPINRDLNVSLLSNDKHVIIDVSTPEATNLLIQRLMDANLRVPLIIGTTGELDMQLIEQYSITAPVAHITNFSDGVPTIIDFSNIINKLPDDWTCRMIETHHINKKDAPSGTAKSWVSKLNRDCQVESIREEEVFGEHTLVLSNSNEEIVIKHTAKNRNIFANGCLKYIDWISEQKPGLYDKMDLTQYNNPRIRKYSASGNILIVAEFIKEKKWSQFVKTESEKDEKLDGIIFLERLNESETNSMKTKWTYYNRDGSKVPFCGNGVRCIGKYLGENYKELTGDIVNPKELVSTYKTEMKSIYFDSPNPIPITSHTQIEKIREVTNQFEFLDISEISMVAVGVPHIVIECNCDIFELDDCIIEYLSKTIHNSFSSNFNINFINVTDKENFQIRTYERGVYRETGSCGSGCIASFYHLYNKTTNVSNKCNANFQKCGSMVVYIDDNEYPKYHLGGNVHKLN